MFLPCGRFGSRDGGSTSGVYNDHVSRFVRFMSEHLLFLGQGCPGPVGQHVFEKVDGLRFVELAPISMMVSASSASTFAEGRAATPASAEAKISLL